MELAYASNDDLDEIVKLFRKHRDIFPHLRPLTLKQSIEKNQMIWSMGVAIQFKLYKRKHRYEEFTCNVGDLHLMKMVSSKGNAERILKRWFYSYGTGRVVLSVRENNNRAIEFYKTLNFEKVAETCWGKSKIKGWIMKLDF